MITIEDVKSEHQNATKALVPAQVKNAYWFFAQGETGKTDANVREWVLGWLRNNVATDAGPREFMRGFDAFLHGMGLGAENAYAIAYQRDGETRKMNQAEAIEFLWPEV